MKTYKDVYEFPLRRDEGTSWVYDAKNQFVFQFQDISVEAEIRIMEILNGDKPLIQCNFTHDKGLISHNGKSYILIRGWGNLTGIGAHHLSDEEAANIQDTFAEFIVERLNSFKD